MVDRFDGYVVPESVGPGFNETAFAQTLAEIATAYPLYPEGVIELVDGLRRPREAIAT